MRPPPAPHPRSRRGTADPGPRPADAAGTRTSGRLRGSTRRPSACVQVAVRVARRGPDSVPRGPAKPPKGRAGAGTDAGAVIRGRPRAPPTGRSGRAIGALGVDLVDRRERLVG